MGSWNETCALSNLPIMTHDPVLFMLIRSSRKLADDTLFYPYDLYQPATPLFAAQYDDYGGAVLNSTDYEKFITWYRLCRQHTHWTDYPDSRRNLRIASDDAAADADDENELPLGLHYFPCFIRQDAFAAMMAMRVGDYDSKTTAEVLTQFRQKVDEAISKELEAFRLRQFFMTYNISQHFAGWEGPTPPVFMTAIENFGDKIILPGKEAVVIPRAMEELEPLFDLVSLMRGMRTLRKTLAPTIGTGSQSWDFWAYQDFSQFIIDAATARAEDCG